MFYEINDIYKDLNFLFLPNLHQSRPLDGIYRHVRSESVWKLGNYHRINTPKKSAKTLKKS